MTAASTSLVKTDTLPQLITGKVPYSAERLSRSQLLIANAIIDPNTELRPTPGNYPVLHQSYGFCWPILTDCWKTKKDERITIEDAHRRLCTGTTSD